MQLRSFSVTWKNMWYLLFGIYRGFGFSGLVWTALYLDDCLNSYAKHHYSLLFSLAECRQCIGNEAPAISSNQQKALNYVRKQNLSPNPRFLPTIVCFRSQVPKVGEALAGLCQANTAGVFTCFRFGFVCFACLFVFLSVCLFVCFFSVVAFVPLTKNCKRAIVHQDLSETANVMFAIWMFGAAAGSRLSSLWQQCKNSSPTHRMMYRFPGLSGPLLKVPDKYNNGHTWIVCDSHTRFLNVKMNPIIVDHWLKCLKKNLQGHALLTMTLLTYQLLWQYKYTNININDY